MNHRELDEMLMPLTDREIYHKNHGNISSFYNQLSQIDYEGKKYICLT